MCETYIVIMVGGDYDNGEGIRQRRTRGLIGKAVILTYPKTEYQKSFRQKVIITYVSDKNEHTSYMRYAEVETEGEGRRSTWIWDTTDVSEYHPNRIEQLLQRMRRK